MGHALDVISEAAESAIDRSAISWTGTTWNPWQGCIKVSAGCKFCYMYRDKKRYGQDPSIVVRSAPPTFRKPLKWQREVDSGKRSGQDRLVFTCSWSDWFIEQADDWRPDAWDIIRATPGLTYQILTKRPERIVDHLPPFWDEIAARCWLGTSVEDQAAADARVPVLLKVPAPICFLSCEPLLGPINLQRIRCPGAGFLDSFDGRGHDGSPTGGQFFKDDSSDGMIDWVIAGGESGGHEARPCNIAWIRSIVEQCAAARVPCWVKQLGTHPFTDHRETDPAKVFPVKGNWTDGNFSPILSDGKGADPKEWPADLRVQQFPRTNP